MREYSILSPSGIKLYDGIFNANCIRKFSLMSEDSVTLKFSVANAIPFTVGCSVGDFFITKSQVGTWNAATGEWDYELKFDAYYWAWANKILRYVIPGVDSARETSFTLTATIDVHANVIKNCLDFLGLTYGGSPFRVDTTDTSLSAEARLVRYENLSVLGGIQAIAEAYDCEWWVEGNAICFGRLENKNSDFTFDAGKNVSSISFSQGKTEAPNRLYVFGSDRNLPTNYRQTDGGDTIGGVVNKRLMLPEGTPYLQTEPDLPESQIVEQVVVLEDIYPKTELTVSEEPETYVSEVENNDGTTTQQTFYRIKYGDAFPFLSSYILPNEELHVIFTSGRLNGMDFGVKFNPKGLNEKATDGSLNPDAQMLEVVANEDYGRMLPDDILKPEKGDTFVLYGWDSTKMADLGLIADAENELLEEGKKALEEYTKDTSTCTCPMAWDYMKPLLAANKEPKPGDSVTIIDTAHFGSGGRKSRIIGYEYKLDVPYAECTYTCGESVSESRLKSIESKIEGLAKSGTKVQMQNSLDFLSKRYADRTPYQLSSDTGFEAGHFSGGVSGAMLGIDAASGQSYAEVDRLYVRMKAYFEQLTIINSSSIGGRKYITPGGSVRISEVEELRDGSGLLTGWRCWYLSEQDGEKTDCFLIEGDQAISEFFNAKTGTSNKIANTYYWRKVTAVGTDARLPPSLTATRTDENGDPLPEDEQPQRTSDNKYGWFELSATDCENPATNDAPMADDVVTQLGYDGRDTSHLDRQSAIMLSTVGSDAPCVKLFSGIDSYSLNGKDIISYGYDPATGKAYFRSYGDMRLGARPEETDGSSIVFDEGLRKFNLNNVALSVNSTIGDQTIEQYIQSVSPKLTEEDIREFVTSIVGPDLTEIQKQIDGAIETWWSNGEPTLYNYPASDWVTDEDKERHLSDLYLDNDTGLAYRFSKDNDGNYFWNDKVDSATAKALADAKEANDKANDAYGLADGKMRVFVTQPTPPYSQGDLWVNATYSDGGVSYSNDILRCKTTRASGDFSISDWELASKYTDDTLAQQAAAAATAAQNAVTNLSTYVNGDFKKGLEDAFADGIITATERSELEGYVNIIENTLAGIKATYGELYANAYLDGSAKTGLKTAYDGVDSTMAALLKAITDAIADDKITDAERIAVDNAFAAFNTATADFNTAVETANKAIQDRLKSYSDSAAAQAAAATAAATAAKTAADAASADAKTANDRLTEWASDGVISPTEKQALKDEIARIDADKEHIDAEYAKYGLGTPKDYNDAYNAYREQLQKLSADTPENIEIPSDFSANQTKYYSERTACLTAISAAADAYAKSLVDTLDADISKRLAGWDSVKTALNDATLIDGALILSSQIRLGTNNASGVFGQANTAGINGIMDSNAKGDGIALWLGGEMTDREVEGLAAAALAKAAATLFRFDGSGYLAKGNISWENDGSGSVAGGNIRWDTAGNVSLGSGVRISTGNVDGLDSTLSGIDATLASILNVVSGWHSIFVPVQRLSDGTLKEQTFEWAAQNPTLVYAVKAKKGLYSEQFITALGLNADGSTSGGGLDNAALQKELEKYVKATVLESTLLGYAKASDLDAYLKKTDAGAYLTSVSFSDLTSHPTTISGYGITDAKIANGVITLGSATITPLVSSDMKKLTFAAGAFSETSYTPDAAAVTVNVPTSTRHIANDSDFTTAASVKAITDALDAAIKANAASIAVNKTNIAANAAAIEALEKKLDEMFELKDGMIQAKYGLWTNQFLTAKGKNADGSVSAGLTAPQVQQLLVQWGYAKLTDIPAAVDLTGYAKESWVTAITDALSDNIDINAQSIYNNTQAITANAANITKNANAIKALTDRVAVFEAMFEWDADNNIKAKAGLWTNQFLTAKGRNADGSTNVGVDATQVNALISAALQTYVTSSQAADTYLTKSDAAALYQTKGAYIVRGTDGVVEGGRYLDFHTAGWTPTDNSTQDYTVRLDGGDSTAQRRFSFPSSGGTLATESFASSAAASAADAADAALADAVAALNATISDNVASLNTAIAAKVAKAGDTMTGSLLMNSGKDVVIGVADGCGNDNAYGLVNVTRTRAGSGKNHAFIGLVNHGSHPRSMGLDYYGNFVFGVGASSNDKSVSSVFATVREGGIDVPTSVKIGEATISWDGSALKVSHGLYSEQFLTAKGKNPDGTTASGGLTAAQLEEKLKGYALASDIPTRVSDLANDSGFITASALRTLTLQVNGESVGTYSPSSAATINIEDVASKATLSTFGTTLTLHRTDTSIHVSTTDRAKWNNAANAISDILGADTNGVIDKWDEIVAFLNNTSGADSLATLLSGKVDKVSGMGLSHNDLTDALLAKLNGIEEGANKYTLPAASSTILGGVKVGNGLASTASGVLSVNLSASHIPNLDWGKITTGKPDSLSGYGITDAYTMKQVDGIEADLYTQIATESAALSKSIADNVATLNAAIAGKVSKSGDTMTGSLHMNSGHTTVISVGDGGGDSDSGYGLVNVTRTPPSAGAPFAFIGLVNRARHGRSIGLDSDGHFVFGGGTVSGKSKVIQTVYATVTSAGIEVPTSVKIGEATISWDSDAKCLKVNTGLYSTSFLTAKGLGSGAVSGGVDATQVNTLIKNYLTANSYATKDDVFAAIPEHIDWADIVNVPTFPDTKNTAGATASSAKLLIVGATSQAASAQTYTNSGCYIGTDGCLYSNGVKVLTGHQSLSAYATQEWVQSKIDGISYADILNTPDSLSSFTNDAGFITAASLSGYLTKTDAASTYQPKGSYLTSHQSLANYVTLDGTQTISGRKTFASTNTPLAYFNNTASGGEPYIYLQQAGTNKAAFTYHPNGYGTCLYDVTSLKYLGIKSDGTPHYQGNTLWHTGNLTPSNYLPLSGGTMSNTNVVTNLNADLLDGVHVMGATGNSGLMRSWARGTFTTVDQYFGNGNVVVIDPKPSDSDVLWANTTIFSVGDLSTRNHQLAFGYSANVIKYRRNNDGWKEWKTLAFTDSNVQSATRLQGSYSLWGQTFYGNNVSGDMTGVGNITASGTMSLTHPDYLAINLRRNQSGEYGCAIGFTRGNGAFTGDIGFDGGGFFHVRNASLATLIAALQNGNVGIGTTSPSYKLHVNGNLNATTIYENGTRVLTQHQSLASYYTKTETGQNFVRALYGNDALTKADMNDMLSNTAFIGSVHTSSNAPNGDGWYNVIQLPHRNGAIDGPDYVGQIALGMTVNHDNMYFRTHRTRTWQRVARYSDIPTSMAWSAITGKPIFSRTSVGDCGWSTYGSYLPDCSALAYWNGAYSGTSSNLAYCAKGAFGDIVTHAHSEYVTALGTSGNYLTYTKNGATNNITVPYASSAASATNANYLRSGGRVTAVTDKSNISSGISMVEVYSNGYPCTYGNVIRVKGSTSSGSGELLLGWSGTSDAVERVYYRNNRDAVTTFSEWRALAFTADLDAYLKTDTAAATYLPLAGGKMTGQINSTNVVPTANNSYSLGSTTYAFSYVYARYFRSDSSLYLSSSSTSTSIILRGGSTEWARLHSSNLGVGTTSPSERLHVLGNARLSSSDTGAGGDVSLELWRGTNASWKILNTGGVLKFQNNYTTKADSYFDVLNMDYNTGTMRLAKSGAKLVVSPYINYDADTIGTSTTYGGFVAQCYSGTTIVSASSAVNSVFFTLAQNACAATITYSGTSTARTLDFGVMTALTASSAALSVKTLSVSGAATIGGAATFSSSISSSSSITASTNLVAGSTTAGTSFIAGNGYIELSHSTPYIDFHHGKLSTLDYTSRIISESNSDTSNPGGGVLKCVGGWHVTKGIQSDTYVTAKTSSSSSDIRLKDVLGHAEIPLADIARSPLVRFAWKGDASRRVNIGTIAQYWLTRLPEVVSAAPDGFLTVAYGVLADAKATVLARHVESHEQKIARLESRVRELESEVKTLKTR